jgi:hypothetical protein
VKGFLSHWNRAGLRDFARSHDIFGVMRTMRVHTLARKALSYPGFAALVACSTSAESGARGDAGSSSTLDGSGGEAADGANGASDGSSGSSGNDASVDAPGGAAHGPVSMALAPIDWQHWNYTLNADNTVQDYTQGARAIVDQTFSAMILENDWVKVTLVPGFGGRILSILYKPTGHEELYQNPVGAPYGYMAGAFYYDWLMVFGGIFPTLAEPEHGKAWLLPWTTQVNAQLPDHISVQMSITDDIAATGVTPTKFNYGTTGLSIVATVTLYSDRSSVDMNVQLTNTQSNDINYEYWTCTTLAPGSTPGSPRATANTEIIAPLSQYQTTWGGWLSGPEYRPWPGGLSMFSAWQDDGILYAYPSATAPFWGVINHDAHEGLLRIADNSGSTPGMKMWTWGYQQSQIDPTDVANAANSARPYIELWGGVSHEFFTPATLPAGGTKQWTESYLPTVGLEQVTSASADGAAYVYAKASGPNVTFAADFFSAHPGLPVTGTLSLDGTPMGTSTLASDPMAPLHFEATQSATSIAAGSHQLTFVATDGINGTLLSATTQYSQ